MIPGSRPTVHVVFATSGERCATPMSTGNARRVPPPAAAFTLPARRPARKIHRSFGTPRILAQPAENGSSASEEDAEWTAPIPQTVRRRPARARYAQRTTTAPMIDEIQPPGVKPQLPSAAERLPNSACPISPPTSEPTMPSTAVASQPICWRPGKIAPAMRPMTRPKIRNPMMLMRASPLRSLVARYALRVYPRLLARTEGGGRRCGRPSAHPDGVAQPGDHDQRRPHRGAQHPARHHVGRVVRPQVDARDADQRRDGHRDGRQGGRGPAEDRKSVV